MQKILLFFLLLFSAVNAVDIQFYQCDSGLHVSILTERLYLRSIQGSDSDDYFKLFSDEKVMEKFAGGQTKTRKETDCLVKDIWAKRWQKCDPYSALAVFDQMSGDFLGSVTLGYGGDLGECSLGYIFLKEHWGKGYATEAVTAVVHEYALRTLEEGYLMKGVPINKISATVRVDNPASERILLKMGMHKTDETEVYGALRCTYSIAIDELQ